jgi:adenylate kinase family enzyme
MIIHIDGVQGSGKSWLCNKLLKLNNIVCIDTDDINKLALDELQKDKNFAKIRNVKSATKKLAIKMISIRDELIQLYGNKDDKLLIFAGMTLPIINADLKYFIKITKFEDTYRKLMFREFTKFFDNKREIFKIIKNDDVKFVNFNIEQLTNISVNIPISYEDFLNDYTERLNDAKKNGYQPCSQKDIYIILKEISR